MENKIKELENRISLLEKVVGELQFRLSFAGEPLKNQTYGPASIEDMLKNKRGFK